MNETELQFRTCTFGGFQKQDVLNYIESSGRAHTEQLENLRRELEEAIRTRAVAEEEGTAARRREESLKADVERLNTQLEREREQLEQARAELARRAEQIAALEGELEQTRSRLEQLEPAARAYEGIKDRTAGMELEAHGRAQAIQNGAEAQAAAIRARVERWLERVQAGYDRMRTDIDATLSHTGGELERVRRGLDGMTEELTRQDRALEELLAVCRENLKAQVPQPLPLEE